MSDTSKTIWLSAQRFFSGTMLSRVTGLGRDIALAFAFGTDSALAAFLVAFRFAHLLRRLLGEGAFQTAFIPSFEELRKNDPEKGKHFFFDLYAALTLVLLFVVTVGIGLCSFLLYTDSLSPGNAEIVWLSLLMFPSLFFICLFGLNASVLQCERYYFLPAAAPVAFNIFWIIGALLLKGLPTKLAMSWLAAFINVACLSQWLITLPATWKIVKPHSIEHLRRLSPFSRDICRFCRPLLLGMLGVAAGQINSALDAVFARWASEEGPAYLWYAIRFQQLPLALIGIAFAGALLPALSRTIQSGNFERYHQLLTSTLRNCMLFMLPITVGIFLFGGFAIKLVYGHGDFSSDSINETTYCLWAYGIGLIPMGAVLVLAPGYYARKDYWTTTMASLASMTANIALNSWFVVGLGWGAASVALATSLSAWLNFFWLLKIIKLAPMKCQDSIQISKN
jgi:putative peptidoglycan lipid II flippase